MIELPGTPEITEADVATHSNDSPFGLIPGLRRSVPADAPGVRQQPRGQDDGRLLGAGLVGLLRCGVVGYSGFALHVLHGTQPPPTVAREDSPEQVIRIAPGETTVTFEGSADGRHGGV